MAATKIRVELKSVQVHDDADVIGAGEWIFKATVRRVATGESLTLGEPEKVFEARTGTSLAIGWQLDVAVLPTDTRIEIRIDARDEDLINDDNVGWVRAILNVPIVHAYDLALPSSTDNYTAAILVHVLEQDAAGAGPVTTILQHSDTNTYNTINDAMLSRMVHICPVIPVPWATGIPPIARGVRGLSASPQVNLAIAAGTTQLNALVNPSLIPVLLTSDPDFANRCARIRITQYRPADLDLARLIWKAATPNIKFWNGSAAKTEITGGQEVNAYGVLAGSDEEGLIEVRWDGEGKPLLALYRAWVGKPKNVTVRANIIKTTATIATLPVPNPTTTAALIKAQIDYNNVILWQSGILMVLDTDATTYNGATRLEEGIFEITTAANNTFNQTLDKAIAAPLLNSRKGVFNIAYLHSIAGIPDLNGAATDRRTSAAEGSVVLGGTPSTSWIQPTGIYPDDDARDVTMLRQGPSIARAATQKSLCGDGALESICACIMTQQGASLPGSLTLAHELGHVLGLQHRGKGGGATFGSHDGVNHLAGVDEGKGHPWVENLMTYGANTRRQDLDLIQTHVIRKHPILKDPPAPPPPPPPPPPPKAPQPIPTAWLPSKDDILLLQEYLVGKRPGLKKSGYDLGTSGPDGNGVDGVNGPKTTAAVKGFQKEHGGLNPDGVYGPLTHDAFEQEINPA
jgi:hypothetical protein